MSEFRLLRAVRDRYAFCGPITDSADEADVLPTLRAFTQKINRDRDLPRHPDQSVGAGQLHAIGLIAEMMQVVVEQYDAQRNPGALQGALAWLTERFGQDVVDSTLCTFVERFPPLAVYRGDSTVEGFVEGHADGAPQRLHLLEGMLVLRLANQNPAFASYRELFDDVALVTDTAYTQITDGMAAYFETQPAFGPADQPLAEMLRSPAVAEPDSIPGQVEYIRSHWSYLLGARGLSLLRGLDVLREETKAAPSGPGPARVYEYSRLLGDAEQFSPDLDWMPSLVLIAKNVYVWLDQLSKWYGQPVHQLDQIPDRELDALARRGFTGLWLIGLWERSSASRQIKQLCGSPDAVASAYSLMDYVIAPSLGGPEAFQNLQIRAWQRSIRLSADMVPNHVGIDSRWVVEHPDWFIALDQSPFPVYSFSGPDLSRDERVGMFLEDHYYDRSDAAVVFKRVDRWTGSERYIYHGNDGTSMPWNDTAQLDYLRPEVREAVIQTILHVARMFPIIRFDAAMTLTKHHFQRLWYPEPGMGGDIPSRSERGLSKAEFDARMPNEFWREVVDRIAAEAPDTLLLAEAFWLLEGYFVRTLGMHRVYNSAFMHMLRDEDNASYRSVIKNTLEFDPQVLKRYVSFMNNPDEETAVNQFGKGDKYFGICTLLATLPGLPMFGHGQIEGLSEKYGMEYQRAYRDEAPDEGLVRRHEMEISPLLRRRRLFAEVDDFLLYDFFTSQGSVNEDVFAYSNRIGDERALVVYHNRYADTQGAIRMSAAYAVRDSHGNDNGTDAVRLEQRPLGEGLGLSDDEHAYTLMRDYVTGREYIRNSHRLFTDGLYLNLGAYRRHVFLDIRQVHDDAARRYSRLADRLAGAGVESVEGALRELALEPLHAQFRALTDGLPWRSLVEGAVSPAGIRGTFVELFKPELLVHVENRTGEFLRDAGQFVSQQGLSRGFRSSEAIAQETRQQLEAAWALVALSSGPAPTSAPSGAGPARSAMRAGLRDVRTGLGILIGWLFGGSVARFLDTGEPDRSGTDWVHELLLDKVVAETLRDQGLDEETAAYVLLTARVLIQHQDRLRLVAAAGEESSRMFEALMSDEDVMRLIQTNHHGGVRWFNKEAFEQMVGWLLVASSVTAAAQARDGDGWSSEAVASICAYAETLSQAAEKSGYRLDALLRIVQDGSWHSPLLPAGAQVN